MSVSKGHFIGCAVTMALSPVLLPVAVVVGIAWLIVTVPTLVAVFLLRSTQGVSYLVVYSDSAQWKQYFEEEVIPSFGQRAAVINLSTDGSRKKWWHLDWLIYRHCAGYRNRFPIVLRFSIFGTWRAVRFYDAFLLAKKGKTDALTHAKARIHAWSQEGRSKDVTP